MSKIPRNKPCPCGSGKKYKKCCALKDDHEIKYGVDISGMTPKHEIKMGDIATEIGVRDDIFDKIDNQDDWAFIIQVHALIETALTELLIKKLGDSFKKVIHELPLKENGGKLGIYKALGCPADFIPFVKAISELRNRLVHNIKNMDFSMNWNEENEFRGNLDKIHNGLCNLFKVEAEFIKKTFKNSIMLAAIIFTAQNIESIDWQKALDNEYILDIQFPAK